MQDVNPKTIEDDESFDADFYKSYYVNLGLSSHEAAVDHWLEEGRRAGFFPTPGKALLAALQDPDLPSDFDLRAYLELNGDVAQSIYWPFQAIEHFKSDGHNEGRVYKFWDDGDFLQLPEPRVHVEETTVVVETDPAHPHADAVEIPAHFNIASYLAANPDIREAASTPADALAHFATYGINEDRAVAPVRYDRQFVYELYGVTLPEGIENDAVPAYMRAALRCGFNTMIFCHEQELLAANGISAEIGLWFDANYYSARYLEHGKRLTRARALLHFCLEGCARAFDIAFLYKFDQDFYFSEYVGAAELGVDALFTDNVVLEPVDRAKLFDNWIRMGSALGRLPNLALLCESHHRIKLPPKLPQSIMRYAQIAGTKPSDVLASLVSGRNVELLMNPDLAPASAQTLTDLGDRMTLSNEYVKADEMYHLASTVDPHYVRARRHRADLYQRQGLYSLAVHLRTEFLRDKSVDEWSNILLMDAWEAMGDQVKMGEFASLALQQLPGKVDLVTKARQSLERGFFRLWDKAPLLALASGYDSALSAVSGYLTRFETSENVYRRSGKIASVAILYNGDLPQCLFYRVEQKIEQLEAAGFRVFHFEYSREREKCLHAIWDIDLVIAFRIPAFPAVMSALHAISSFGVPIIYDIDDLIFDTMLFPPPYETYERQITKRQHAEIAMGVPLFRKAIAMSDFAMASTTPLLERMVGLSREAHGYRHPNAMSAQHYAAMDRNADRVALKGPACTIFYGSGTKAHKSAFKELLLPALIRIAEKHSKAVKIVIIGTFGLLSKIPADLRWVFDVREPLKDMEQYWDELATADINLSVLEEGEVPDAKSEIKWLEAAMFAIPSIVSPTATYREVLTDGENGLFAATEDEFFDNLDELVTSRERRTEIGEAAKRHALKNYGQSALVRSMYEIVLDVERRLPTKKKKLLVVNVFYPPQSIGGATRVVHDNVRDLRALAGNEWEITVLATKEGGLIPYEIDWHTHDGVRVFTITAPSAHDIDQRITDEGMTGPIEKCIQEIQPDLVHLHCIQRLTTTVVDVLNKHHIKYLLTIHDGWWTSPNQFILGPDGQNKLYKLDRYYGLSHPLAATLTPRQRVIKGAVEVLTVSEPFAETCRQAGVDRIRVVENGVSSIPSIARTPNTTGRVRLGHFGGLEAHKGFPRIRTLLQSLEFLNLSMLVLDHAMAAGDVRIEQWGNTVVEIRGRVPPSEVWSLYARTDVFLAPSLWPESYGLVSREALSCGCWVVASNCGAISEPVEHGINGFIVDMETDEELIRVLKDIDSDPDRYLREPPKPVLRSAKAQAEELLSIYRSLVPGAAGGKN